MNPRKAELRKIVLDILLRKEAVKYPPSQFGNLTYGVAEVLAQRSGQGHSASVFHHDETLNESDWQLVQEIFWDLVCERVISPGLDSSNREFPWFRVHEDAAVKLK